MTGRSAAGPAVIDCARRLPFDEALAIADSAVRAGDVTPGELLRLAERVPSTGRAEALRVARCVDGRAANPFVRACLDAAATLPPPVRPRRRAALPVPGRRAA